MPTVIRRSETIALSDKRREVLHAVGWQVMQSIWSPPTDVYETAEEYTVRVEVAGMRETDFEVVYQERMLLIAGVREDSAERRAYHQMEIRFGKFSTSVVVPGPIDLDKSSAEYKDGFLTVTLRKARPTTVNIEG